MAVSKFLIAPVLAATLLSAGGLLLAAADPPSCEKSAGQNPAGR